MRSCSIPLCRSSTKLHCVPFGKRERWEQWLNIFPYFRKYNLKQLENVRICEIHFQPHHIGENGRLTNDAYPLYYLKKSELTKKYDGLKGDKVLEICPLESDNPVNIKITDPGPISQAEKEGGHLTYIVYLKAGDKGGLPVDHNRYCLPPQKAESLACLPSPGLDESVLGSQLPEMEAAAAPQKQTLESLVAPLIHSEEYEEIMEVESCTTRSEPKCTITLPSSNLANSHSVHDTPLIEFLPLTCSTKIKHMNVDKENCTDNERNLSLQNNQLKKKFRTMNFRYKHLKSKLDALYAKASGFIKSYPRFNPRTKLLIDMQIRLAKASLKGKRYSKDEKMFAIKLFKMSPECYNFLQTYIKFPRKSTVREAMKNAI